MPGTYQGRTDAYLRYAEHAPFHDPGPLVAVMSVGGSYLTKVRLHGRMSSIRLPTPREPSNMASTGRNCPGGEVAA